MKNILIVLVIIGYLSSFSYIKADEIQPKQTINDIISINSLAYNVSQETLLSVIKCESSMNPEAHNHTKRENSYGLVQINLKAHPEIKKEQALDPSFSIDYLARKISENKGNMWSCYKKLNYSDA